MKTEGGRRVWAVGEVTRALAQRLAGIPAVWIEAEIHSVRRSGDQVYFTLVDGDQISASMAASAFSRVPRPHEGARVQAHGRVEFRRARTRLSLRVDALELTGEGALLARIAELRARLEAAGMLDAGRKRPVPLLPRRVGVVTSRRGAAVEDLVSTMRSRHPGVDVVLADVPVQGAVAAGAVARAIRRLNEVAGVDVIVVTRGGGPLEDLMAFNSETVCRAVAGSRVPVVSAVGHERDVTLCDLVADVRVATPTAAATMVTPDAAGLVAHLEGARGRMATGLRRAASAAGEAGDLRRQRLGAGLEAARQRAVARLGRVESHLVSALTARSTRAEYAVERLAERMDGGVHRRLDAASRSVSERTGLLTALSPFEVLGRGYAIVHTADGRPAGRASAIDEGASVTVRMADGTFDAAVKEVRA